MKFQFVSAAALVSASLTLSGPALAADAQAFAERLTEFYAQNSFVVQFDDVRSEGEDVILSGLQMAPGDEDLVDFDVEARFSNVQMDDDGNYTAESGVVENFSFEEDDIGLNIAELRWDDVFIPASNDYDPVAMALRPVHYSSGEISVSNKGEQVFRLDGFTVDAVPFATGTGSEITYSVDGIFADLSTIEDADDMIETLEPLDLLQLRARMNGSSTWLLDDGQLEITESAFIIDNIGRFNLKLDLLGYDADFLTALYDMQRSTTAGDADPDAMGEQAMSLFQDLFLNGMSFRFDDDGITGKLLDISAEEQGIPRAAMTIGFSAMLPVLASEIGISDEMQTELLQAATTFMTSPQSIEITVTPDKPVRFSRIGAAAEDEDAAALVEMLNPKLIANQPENGMDGDAEMEEQAE